ncbi:hypothetical protein ANO11243_021580 [Dothideomycetidae sp. 11243]|nr:hypothetical protein ANO11243_021580 [fungal sp. No.11243]
MAQQSFESLPPELFLKIYEHLDDLDSLDSLLRASPVAFRVFSEYGVEILDRILDSGNVSKNAQEIIRTIAYIRQGSFPIPSLGELQERVTSKAILRGTGARYDNQFFPRRFPPKATPKLLCGILATARRITYQTLDCLEVYLKRLREVKPYVASEQRRYDTERSVVDVLRMTENDPARTIYEVRDIGPPNWIEEQLVYRAFWQIQLVEDLRVAVNRGIVPGWTKVEKEKLNDFSIFDIYDFEEMARMCYNLEIYNGDGTYGDSHELVDQGVYLSVRDYLETLASPLDTQEWRSLQAKPAPPCPVPWPYYPPEGYLEGELSFAVEEFNHVYWEPVEESYYRVIDFNPYRRLGFSIWSGARLRGYGFDDYGHEGPDLIIWMSVLGPEELATLQRRERRTDFQLDRPYPSLVRTTKAGSIVPHINPLAQSEWDWLEKKYRELEAMRTPTPPRIPGVRYETVLEEV